MKYTFDIENTKGKICNMYYSFNDASKTETIKLVKDEKEIEINEKDFKKLIKLLLRICKSNVLNIRLKNKKG